MHRCACLCGSTCIGLCVWEYMGTCVDVHVWNYMYTCVVHDYVQVYMCEGVHVYMSRCTCMELHVCMCRCTCVGEYMYICVGEYMCMYTCLVHVYICRYMSVCGSTHIHVQMYMCGGVHVYICSTYVRRNTCVHVQYMCVEAKALCWLSLHFIIIFYLKILLYSII